MITGPAAHGGKHGGAQPPGGVSLPPCAAETRLVLAALGGLLLGGAVVTAGVLLTGCIPDLGVAASDAAGATDSAPPSDSGTPPDAGASDSGPPAATCDLSPPSQEVDRYVWGENFTFYFTPAGAEITKLFVPANSLVHFSLGGSIAEEVHIFQIVIPGCETPEVGLGTEGNETTWDWKAPLVPGTYPLGGICVNHTGMEFDVVVTP